MWYNLLFIQGNKTTERKVGLGVGGDMVQGVVVCGGGGVQCLKMVGVGNTRGLFIK